MVGSIVPEYYPLGVYDPPLMFGRRLIPQLSNFEPMDSKSSQLPLEFHPHPGVYNARDIVAVTSPLLNSVLQQLGPDKEGEESAEDTLINGLAASLATSGRESSLPLFYNSSDTSRKEVARQAYKIGRDLVVFVRETTNLQSGDPDIQLHSQCEGHLWTPSVATLLLGRRSSPNLMALYNEWLHRMILLRDSLIPFENYENVPLVFANSSSNGLRQIEERRKFFLVQCISKQVPHAAFVHMAKAFTAPDLPPGGYGFQYSQGLVLPAFLSGSSSRYLLRYHPARLDDLASNLLFDYEFPAYYHAQKAEIPDPTQKVSPGAWPPPSLLSLNPEVTKSSIEVNKGSEAFIRILKLELVLDTNVTVSVDLGQIARGRRYVYQAESKLKIDGRHNDSSGFSTSSNLSSSLSPVDGPETAATTAGVGDACLSNAFLHNTRDTLSQTGLVAPPADWALQQIHVLPALNPLIKLALLGKLYPGNVILLNKDEDMENVVGIGKGFGAKFVVLQDQERENL